MPNSFTTTPESDSDADCHQQMRGACAAEPFYKEHDALGITIDDAPDLRAALLKMILTHDAQLGLRDE